MSNEFKPFAGMPYRFDADGSWRRSESRASSSQLRRSNACEDFDLAHIDDGGEQGEKTRMDNLITVTTAWQSEVPVHKYTEELLDSIVEFQTRLLVVYSLYDKQPVRQLVDGLIPEFADLREQVKPFLSYQPEADDADDDDDDATDDDGDKIKPPKRRRFKKKALDTTGAYDIAEDID